MTDTLIAPAAAATATGAAVVVEADGKMLVASRPPQ